MPEIPFSPSVHTLTAVLQVCIPVLLQTPGWSVPPHPRDVGHGQGSLSELAFALLLLDTHSYSLFLITLTIMAKKTQQQLVSASR